METDRIKKEMMKLWKETFHDTDEYVNLIFEKNFDQNWIAYHIDNDKIVSALLGIPYEFKYGKNTIKAIYLCGLATKGEFRNKGLMKALMNQINAKAATEGFAFSFLIPASESLRIYYQNKGYFNGMYRVEERFTEVHDFEKEASADIRKEPENIRTLKAEYFQNIKVSQLVKSSLEDRDKITEYIQANEARNRNFANMIHSKNDVEAMLEENFISNGKIYFACDGKGIIKGCGFVTFDSNIRLTVPKIYFDDNYIYNKILDRIKKDFQNLPMSVFRYPEEVQRKVIWGINYIEENRQPSSEVDFSTTEGVYDVSSHSQPYGMVKILNLRQVLKFLSDSKRDLKFSILINEGEDGYNRVSISDGKISIEPVTYSNLNRNELILKKDEFYSLLLRKKDNSALITETLKIPRLALNMALLLD